MAPYISRNDSKEINAYLFYPFIVIEFAVHQISFVILFNNSPDESAHLENLEVRIGRHVHGLVPALHVGRALRGLALVFGDIGVVDPDVNVQSRRTSVVPIEESADVCPAGRRIMLINRDPILENY